MYDGKVIEIAYREKEIISQIEFGDMAFIHILDKENQNVGLTAVSTRYISIINNRKQYNIDSIVQVKTLGEEGFVGLFSKGKTMRNSISTSNFKFYKQEVLAQEGGRDVITYLRNDKNHILEHRLTGYKECQAIEIKSVFRNNGSEDVFLEMLSSF